MALPKPPDVERVKVEVLGEQVEVRALTRAEALALRGEGPMDLGEMEARLVAFGTDTPLDEAKAWLAAVPAGAVQPLVEKISEISGVVAEGPTRPAPD